MPVTKAVVTDVPLSVEGFVVVAVGLDCVMVMVLVTKDSRMVTMPAVEG